MTRSDTSEGPADLSATLLHADMTPCERRPKSRWVHSLAGLILVSGFVAFHSLVLLVWNTPGKGLARPFHKTVLGKTQARRYFKATGNVQSWNMFAPNPNRSNVFVRVLVEDHDGEIWDLKHDIWAVDRHPYWFYDRMGKINRRIDGKKNYQRYYGAWVCRQWEREHEGQRAKSVNFIKRYTRVPKPNVALENWGWNPWELEFKQVEQETISCKTTINAQLPDHLRVKYGLEPHPDGVFKEVRPRTWHTKLEAAAAQEEREARRAERKRKMKEKRAEQNATGRSGPVDTAPGPGRESAIAPREQPSGVESGTDESDEQMPLEPGEPDESEEAVGQ